MSGENKVEKESNGYNVTQTHLSKQNEAAAKVQSHAGMYLRAVLDVRQRKEIILLYLPLKKPQWKYCIQSGALHLKTDVYQLEIIQRKTAEMNSF